MLNVVHTLSMIFIDGAHNSMADLRSSPRTQWNSKDLQSFALAANAKQFFLLAAASNKDRFAGHVGTVLIVCKDALQGAVNASEKLI